MRIDYEHNNGIKALAVNTFILFFYLLFFPAQLHVDDLAQWYNFSGIFSGTVENHMLWSGDILAILLKGLLKISPSTQWLGVVEVTMAFLALTITTYVILNYSWGKVGDAIILCFLLLFGYECYVTLMFTKCAGIVGVLSAFNLLSLKIGWKCKIICAIDFLLAISMRGSFLEMVLGTFAIIVFIRMSLALKTKGKVKRIVQEGIWLLVVIIVYYIISCIISSALDQDEVWQDFRKWDAFRSYVYDYGLIYEDYAENAAAYAELGITEGEAAFWYTNNNDFSFPNDEIRELALKIAQDDNDGGALKEIGSFFNPESLIGFMKAVPLKMLTIDTFFLLIVVILLLTLSTERKRTLIISVLSIGIVLLLNYYLYCSGRYLRHRVDVSICLIGFVALIYLLEDSCVKETRINNKVLSLLILVALIIPYNYYADDYFFYSDSVTQQIKNNQKFYEQTSENLENVYVQFITSGRTGGIGVYDVCVSSNAFTSIPRGYLENVFLTVNVMPIKQQLLKDEYDMSDLYLDAIDNENVYYICPSDDILSLVDNYLDDRAGKDISLELVKTYSGKKVYRPFSSESVFLNEIGSLEKATADTSLTENIDALVSDNKLTVDGVIPDSSFSQDVYIKVVDSQSDDEVAYLLPQYIADGNGNGLKARVEFQHILPDFYDAEDEIYFVVKVNNENTKYASLIE